MIRTQALHKSFKKNHVLRGLDLQFKPPGITAILGPNGSGKTTLIKTILGMVLPDSGDIYIDDKSILGESEYRNNIDYLPQIARFPENLTTAELLQLIRDLRKGSVREQELIDTFEIGSFLNKKLGTLSGGMRQKVNLTLALMYDSPIIILDEPTSGLDPLSVLKLKEILDRERQRGKIILITTHIMEFVEQMADRILFILDGQIVFDGNLEEIKSKYDAQSLEESIALLLKSSDHIMV